MAAMTRDVQHWLKLLKENRRIWTMLVVFLGILLRGCTRDSIARTHHFGSQTDRAFAFLFSLYL